MDRDSQADTGDILEAKGNYKCRCGREINRGDKFVFRRQTITIQGQRIQDMERVCLRCKDERPQQ